MFINTLCLPALNVNLFPAFHVYYHVNKLQIVSFYYRYDLLILLYYFC